MVHMRHVCKSNSISNWKCPLCFSFVLFVLFFLFVVVVSGEPKQKQGRGLVDHKLVQAPQ